MSTPTEAPSVALAAPWVVLLVEDEADNRDALADLLVDAGLAVHAVANGQEALDYLQANPRPKAMVTDLMMPVMNGWELLQRLEADRMLLSIPVIVTSATRHPKLAERIPVLEKPIDVDTLIAALYALPTMLKPAPAASLEATTPTHEERTSWHDGTQVCSEAV